VKEFSHPARRSWQIDILDRSRQGVLTNATTEP
jgi:hypothetical protein